MNKRCIIYTHPTIGTIYIDPNSSDYDDVKRKKNLSEINKRIETQYKQCYGNKGDK